MLHSFFYLFSFRIIEAIKCAYEISCDSSDTLKPDTFADFTIYTLYFVLIH